MEGKFGDSPVELKPCVLLNYDHILKSTCFFCFFLIIFFVRDVNIKCNTTKHRNFLQSYCIFIPTSLKKIPVFFQQSFPVFKGSSQVMWDIVRRQLNLVFLRSPGAYSKESFHSVSHEELKKLASPQVRDGAVQSKIATQLSNVNEETEERYFNIWFPYFS